MKTVGYVRFSPRPQELVDRSISIETQIEKIRAWGKINDCSIDVFIEDRKQSAKDMRRPGLQRLMAMMKRREVNTLVVVKIDRLTRSAIDMAHLVSDCEKYQVKLVSVTEPIDTGSIMGRGFIQILRIFAQMERERSAERVSEAIQYIRASGRPWGPAPYGYRLEDKALVEDDHEQEIIREILALRYAGLTYREISGRLENLGRKPRRGEKWSTAVIAGVLERASDLVQARLSFSACSVPL